MVLDASAASNKLQLALRTCRGAFGYAALFSFCINVLTVLSSLYSMQVLDRVLSSRSMETLLMLSLLMVVAMIFLGAFAGIRTLILDQTGAWLERTLGPELLSNAIVVSAAGSASSATQQQRDLTSLRQFITGAGIVTLFDAPWSVVYLLVTFAISVTLGWLALAGCMLLLLLGVLTEYATRRETKDAQAMHLRNLAFADAAARHADAVEAMGMWPAMLARWQRQFNESQNLQESADKRSAIVQSITRSIRMVLQVLITGVGAYLALSNELTAGGMIAAAILAARAFSPFENAIAFWKQFIMTQDAYQRLAQSAAVSGAARGEMALPAPKGWLSLEQVGYHPSPNAPAIVRNVALELSPGESLGLIGPSGAGKSTLVRLLTGVIAPTHGHVRLDGNDVSTWNRSDLGQWIGYLSQQVELFAGTIRENIARMQEDADPDAVIKAARMANVHELIQRLPMGYDTVWSPANPCLSPGQKQRIALARAFFGDPKLIVLDEPNLNLDGEGEMALVGSLQQLKLKRITTVVVAHKPSIIACLDKILVLKDGAVVQYGAREQLLQALTRPQTAKVQ